MARPKKRRGFRPIQVNEIVYRWRFKPGVTDSILQVTPAETKGQMLAVQMVDWVNPIYYPWYWFVETQYIPRKNEPEIITSKFVKQAILFALKNGWKPETSGSDFRVTYLSGEFKAVNPLKES